MPPGAARHLAREIGIGRPIAVDRGSVRCPADAICFGHGQPLLGRDTAALGEAATAAQVPDPLG